MRAALTIAVLAVLAGAAPAAARYAPPGTLPGDASAAAVAADPATWIVGARASARTDAIARAAGARMVLPGAYEVARSRARALAARLHRRGLLLYTEPNRLARLRQTRAVPDDPLSPQARWRDAAVDPALQPPPVADDSPLLALIDSKIDAAHPEFGGGRVSSLDGPALGNSHGTATAAVAAAPVNGVGIVGVWPGMRALNVPLPADRISCADSARGIVRALDAGAAVINMSYGSAAFCFLEYQALQLATFRRVTLVAAAGNEFGDGNPLEFPASLPHVLTVAALTPDDTSAFFSNENAAIDLAAPGVSILTAVPGAYDGEDGNADGYQLLDGTSFAAPIVAAAAAWVRAERPSLSVDQVAQVLRLSARDVGRRGYEASTGFGALDLRAALAKEPPPRDPLEPNEDIPFVDGTAFDRRDRAIWNGRRRARQYALLDVFEDPGDVYRLRIPPRRRARISVSPQFGNPDLELYSGRADHVTVRRQRLRRSARAGERIDRVAIRNGSRVTQTFYVRVFIRGGQRSLDAGYTLRVR